MRYFVLPILIFPTEFLQGRLYLTTPSIEAIPVPSLTCHEVQMSSMRGWHWAILPLGAWGSAQALEGWRWPMCVHHVVAQGEQQGDDIPLSPMKRLGISWLFAGVMGQIQSKIFSEVDSYIHTD